MSAPKQLPYLNTRDDQAFRFLGVPTLMRSTAETTQGAFGLIEQWMMPPGFASPYHTHHREDEAFYVLEGQLAFVCDGKWQKGGPGTYVFGPREIPHGFKVVGSQPARILLLCAPAGFEHFVLELAAPYSDSTPPDMAKLLAGAAKYHVDIHGPLPRQTGEEELESAPAGDSKSLNFDWIQAFNQRDWKSEAAFRGPAFRACMSGSKEPLDNDAWAGFMSVFTTAFPDARISVDDSIAEGDTVASRWTLTGTHRGEFQGVPPTGQAVAIAGVDFSRVTDGKFSEHWAQFDLLGVMQQIGAFGARA